MDKNKLYFAAAGSGKTTFLVNEALKQKDGNVLITTYTQANESEIRKKIIEINKCIPENITIRTWFSFLLKHGAKPYQGCLFNGNIKGLLLVNSPSVRYVPENNTEKHYFTKDFRIYSDKLAKFVYRCNVNTKNAVINRLSRIYSHIFIDEIQDLAGYDLELLKLFFDSNAKTLLVGDPRQATYSTNSSLKNKKFKKSAIVDFFQDKSQKIEIDSTTLTTNYRSNAQICSFSNRFYPEFPTTTSGNNKNTGHDGVFFVKRDDVDFYLKKFNPLQLRDSVKTVVNERYKVMNFGDSKGLSFDRVLIYPTKPFVEWLINKQSELAPTSLSKFYVAVTRASYSVSIVYDYNSSTPLDGIINFNKFPTMCRSSDAADK